MANRIAETTQIHLDAMDPIGRGRAEDEVMAATLRAPGHKLDLEAELNLFKAIKCVAAVDGLSREELTALKFIMIMAGLQPAEQRHVLEFDGSGVDIEHVAELFPAGTRTACYVLSGATTVAAIDGLSEDEERYARELGLRLALPARLIEVMIAEARATAQAMHQGYQPLVVELIKLRQAIHALVDA
jgi:tellurite resistance protein